MSETETAAVVPTTWNTTEALRIDGDAVEKLATLGARATGIEIAEVEYDSDLPGLPSSFPLAILHGDKPELLSVKRFAEEWRTHPAYRAGQARTLTLESFIALVNRHKDETSVVFADTDWRKPGFTAVIDYHGDGFDAAGNGKHRVHYAFPLSEEWKAWIEGDGKPMDQADFAAMIEDRMAELSSPDAGTRTWMERDFQTTIATPAQLITLARGLEVNVSAKVKDFKVLQSGAGQVVFEETHSGADGQAINIPGLFVLGISPFFMSDKIEIPVRLRYRVRQGTIIWFYQIYRPDASITEAVRNAMLDVRGKTELPVYEGAPEMTLAGSPVGA